MTDESMNGREIFEISSKAIAKLEAERDAWKLRCEAVERDLGRLYICETCKYGGKYDEGPCEICMASDKCGVGWRMNHFEWRGPCAENGGMKDD